MLVLSRSVGEDILIGDNDVDFGDYVIKINVVEVSKGKVRIGIEAPDDLKILRSELVRNKETVQ
jgi:carbon storage regulator